MAARSYEPLAFVTHTTANNISQLMNFYELTGDRSYLERVGEALDWLDAVKLPEGVANDRRSHPTFIEIGTNRPLYVHRRGSNVVNGAYYATYDLEGSITHYSPTRMVRTAEMRARLAKLQATSPEDASRNSPLKASQPLPRFFTTQNIEVSDLNSNRGAGGPEAPTEDRVAKIVAELNAEDWWPTPLVGDQQSLHRPAGADATAGAGDLRHDARRRFDRHLALCHGQSARRHFGGDVHSEHGRAEPVPGGLGGFRFLPQQLWCDAVSIGRSRWRALFLWPWQCLASPRAERRTR